MSGYEPFSFHALDADLNREYITQYGIERLTSVGRGFKRWKHWGGRCAAFRYDEAT